jgi:FkbM family methyltransferase
MHYNYVDIGSCNFDNSANFAINDPSINVLLVEPLNFYIEYFKSNGFEGKENIKLCNSAISDTEGTSTIYYLPEEFINKYIPDKKWLRGCNRLDKEHPLIVSELQQKGIDLKFIQKLEIKKITFDMLCDLYNIESISKLTIDTEGHEHFILPSIIQKIKNGMIIQSLYIEFQSYLSNQLEMEKLFRHFSELNYTRTNHLMDVELTLQ